MMNIRMNGKTFVLLFIGLFVAPGIAISISPLVSKLSGPSPPADTLVAGTKEYKNRVKQFALTSNQARSALAAYTSKHGLPFLGRHDIVIGSEYIFSASRIASIPLQGYYVDGNTGNVRYVESSLEIRRQTKW